MAARKKGRSKKKRGTSKKSGARKKGRARKKSGARKKGRRKGKGKGGKMPLDLLEKNSRRLKKIILARGGTPA